jgi:hypothetical protein
VTPSDGAATSARGRWFWLALGVGWAVMVGAGVGAVLDSHNANLAALVRYVVIFDVVHDLTIAPLVVAVAWLAGRWLPPVALGPVRGALALTAIVIVFATPLVRRFTRTVNSSALPLDYGRNVVIVLGVVWVAAAGVIVVRLAARRLRRPAPSALP